MNQACRPVVGAPGPGSLGQGDDPPVQVVGSHHVTAQAASERQMQSNFGMQRGASVCFSNNSRNRSVYLLVELNKRYVYSFLFENFVLQ